MISKDYQWSLEIIVISNDLLWSPMIIFEQKWTKTQFPKKHICDLWSLWSFVIVVICSDHRDLQWSFVIYSDQNEQNEQKWTKMNKKKISKKKNTFGQIFNI